MVLSQPSCMPIWNTSTLNSQKRWLGWVCFLVVWELSKEVLSLVSGVKAMAQLRTLEENNYNHLQPFMDLGLA